MGDGLREGPGDGAESGDEPGVAEGALDGVVELGGVDEGEVRGDVFPCCVGRGPLVGGMVRAERSGKLADSGGNTGVGEGAVGESR